MACIERCIVVRRPLPEVWDLWTDVRLLPRLSPSTDEVRDAPDRLDREGQTFVQVARVAARRVEVAWTVTSVGAGEHLTISSTPAPGTTVTITESVRPAGDPGAVVRSATEARLTMVYELPLGPFGRIAARLGLERRAAEEATGVLVGLAALAETGDPGATAGRPVVGAGDGAIDR